jgi:hypothetical protein
MNCVQIIEMVPETVKDFFSRAKYEVYYFIAVSQEYHGIV